MEGQKREADAAPSAGKPKHCTEIVGRSVGWEKRPFPLHTPSNENFPIHTRSKSVRSVPAPKSHPAFSFFYEWLGPLQPPLQHPIPPPTCPPHVSSSRQGTQVHKTFLEEDLRVVLSRWGAPGSAGAAGGCITEFLSGHSTDDFQMTFSLCTRVMGLSRVDPPQLTSRSYSKGRPRDRYLIE